MTTVKLKMRRTPYFDPLSPHGIRIATVKKLVKAKNLAQKNAWGRELSILKKLQLKYNSDDFWLNLNPAEQVESLAYFIGPYGSASVEKEWHLYLFMTGQGQAILHPQNTPDSGLASDYMFPTIRDQQLKKKENAVTWTDSPE